MKIFTGALGSTTVPISRPSTTQRPASSAIARCRFTRFSRTSGIAEIAETWRVTSAPRISAETSSPSSRTSVESGSSLTCIGSVAEASTIRETEPASAGSKDSMSIPWRSTCSVATRYIAPVSKYLAPAACAMRRQTVDFPVPEGPSTARMNPPSTRLSTVVR